MEEKAVHVHTRAIYRDGTLTLVQPLDIPNGTEVQLAVEYVRSDVVEEPAPPGLSYPTRGIPAERLKRLVGIVSLGGDALEDSEALYDEDYS